MSFLSHWTMPTLQGNEDAVLPDSLRNETLTINVTQETPAEGEPDTGSLASFLETYLTRSEVLHRDGEYGVVTQQEPSHVQEGSGATTMRAERVDAPIREGRMHHMGYYHDDEFATIRYLDSQAEFVVPTTSVTGLRGRVAGRASGLSSPSRRSQSDVWDISVFSTEEGHPYPLYEQQFAARELLRTIVSLVREEETELGDSVSVPTALLRKLRRNLECVMGEPAPRNTYQLHRFPITELLEKLAKLS